MGAPAIPAPGLSETVLSAGLLRALDSRGRAELALASRAHELERGDVLFAAGAPADAVFVVARGRLRVGGSVDPRAVEPGDLFGWDAALPGGVRSGAATAVEGASVVALPLASLRRALTRCGVEELLAREERRFRLRAFRALLAGTELGAALGAAELERVVKGAREVAFAPGDSLWDADQGQVAWLVVSGLVALDGGASGYAARGSIVGLEQALDGCAGHTPAAAVGQVLALGVPAELLAELRRVHPDAVARELAAARRRGERQRRVFGAVRPRAEAEDPFGRLEVASSLLTIDVAACADCGHCVRACADTHGAARFVRRGERVGATVALGNELAARAYLLPNACQHCKEPACLSACPTAALVRDARGAVQIRPELCTGCGACVGACAWDAVRLAPTGSGSAAVAVKCDLCSGRDGPECVLACPTGAIARVEPTRDFVELRVAVGGLAKPRVERSSLGPWLARAAVLPPLAVALALAGNVGGSTRHAAGVLGALLLVVLAAHGIVKRVPRARSAAGRVLRRLLAEPASLAPLVGMHSALGVLSVAAIVVHTGGSFGSGVAGALTLAYSLLVGTGAVGGALYSVVPRRLARLEPGREPAPGSAELERRLFAALSGGNDAVRALARAFLIPHARSAAGAFALLCSRRTPEDEGRTLTASIQAALGGKKSARLAGLDSLVGAAVAIRAERSLRMGRSLLRAFVPVHLVLAALLVALLVLHAAGTLR